MNEQEPTSGDETEPTQPLPEGRSAEPPAMSWVPPTVQSPPGPPPGPWTSYPLGSQAQPPSGHAAPAGRVPGWLWPVVCALALVLGIVGGVAGSIVYDEVASNSGTVRNGLLGVDTVSVPPLPQDNGSVAAVAQALLPSTVQISAEYDGEKGGATGSGFVLDRQGHIITNNHVVANAAADDGPIEIVDQDGNRYEATLVGLHGSLTPEESAVPWFHVPARDNA